MSKEKNISAGAKPKEVNNKVPGFSPSKAKAIEPEHHRASGRTVCFVQEGHLFTATGVHVGEDDGSLKTEPARGYEEDAAKRRGSSGAVLKRG